MKDDPIKVCPECTGTTKRLLYPVGVVFKGSGWYVNDSRKPDTSESDHKAAAAASEKKTESTADGTAKSDASAKTSETKSDTSSSSATTTEGATGGSPKIGAAS